MNKPPSHLANTVDSILVSPGKSSRLQEMRDKAMAGRSTTVSPAKNTARKSDQHFSPELMLARQLIDRHLADILATLPAGRQRRLFKIRFGVELDSLKDLPIKQIFNVLKISHPQLNNLSTSMKRIGDLNYNGGQPN